MLERTRPSRIMRIKDLCLYIGISRASIYNKWNQESPYYDPTFPQKIEIGVRSIGVLSEDVDNWISMRKGQSLDSSMQGEMK